MTRNLIFTLLVAVAACSGQSESPAAATSAQAPARGTAPVPMIPAEIHGLPFAIGGKCTVDSVNTPQKGETIRIKRTEGMRIEGWAFDDKSGTVPAVAVLQMVAGGNRYHYALLERRTGRDDLAKTFAKAEYGAAGFTATVDITTLPPGLYDMLIVQKTATTNLVCPTYRKLEVGQ